MKEIIKLENGRKRVRTVNTEPTLTEQQHKDDCDVNKVLEKYYKTGTLRFRANAASGVYADLTQVPVNLHDAMNIVAQANSAFEEVPAEIRKKFDNDPGKMIDWLKDEKNTDEAIKLGLVVPPTVKPEDPVLSELQKISKNTTKTTKKTNESNE